MPCFVPCAGTRGQIDSLPVEDGQFLVAIDTGEAFVDYDGRRIVIGSIGGKPHGQSLRLTTEYSIAGSPIMMSESVPGGGPGGGVRDAPEVILPVLGGDLTTDYPTADRCVLPSDSISGGGPSGGVCCAPYLTLKSFHEDMTTDYSIVEDR